MLTRVHTRLNTRGEDVFVYPNAECDTDDGALVIFKFDGNTIVRLARFARGFWLYVDHVEHEL